MSTLKAGAIRGTGASSDAITVHSTDGTFSGNITNRPNKNALINGGMQIAQRASSNTAINTYGPLDRWRTIGGPMGFTITQVTDATNYPNTHYALKAHRTAGNTQEYDLGVVQGIETLNSRPFAGKECTFSFRARVGANFSGPSSVLKALIWTGTGTDDNPANMTNHNSTSQTDITVSTTATKYSVTYTIPSSATQITCGVFYQCRGTAGANDWFEITDCQFELGSVPSDFGYCDFQSELARCQRYCWVQGEGNWSTFAQGTVAGSNSWEGQARLPVTMRAKPSVTVSGTTRVWDAGGATNASATGTDSGASTKDGVWHTATCSGASFTTGRSSLWGASNDSSARVTYSAEL